MSALHEQIHLQAPSAFALDVLDGLAHRQRRVPGQWLYDDLGARLFERLTEQPEHALTRIEAAILQQAAAQIAEAAGAHATLIEWAAPGHVPGPGTSVMLEALDRPAAYAPVHTSLAGAGRSLQAIAARFPHLRMRPLIADFAQLTSLPPGHAGGRHVVFMPGPAIGRFHPAAAEALLARLARAAGAGALLVIGLDHTRDPARMVPAYDDRAGSAAALNRNLLVRINRELRGDFDAEAFGHLVRFVPEQQRIELHLASTRPQRASVLGRSFDFAIGESIRTEIAWKPSPFQFLALAHRAGWRQRQLWVDGAAGVAVHVLEAASLS